MESNDPTENFGINIVMEQHPSGADVNAEIIEYVQRMKLAVAVAIVKSKPSDLKVEDYVVLLAESLHNKSEDFEQKCHKLEYKVLALEQQLQSSQLEKNMTDIGFDYETQVARRVERKDKISNSLTSQGITGCESGKFVESFILFNSITSSGDSSACGVQLHDTILESLTSLFHHLRNIDGLKLSLDILQKSVLSVHRMFQWKEKSLKQKMVACCLNFVDALLSDILSASDINVVFIQNRRSFLIQLLAEHPALSVPVFLRLIRELTIFSDFLKNQILTDNSETSYVVTLENAYYILQCLEAIVGIFQQRLANKEGDECVSLPLHMATEWKTDIQDALLTIGTRFPLFSLYVWHIHSLLNTVTPQD